jgi:hypothetical protein
MTECIGLKQKYHYFFKDRITFLDLNAKEKSIELNNFSQI